MFLVVVLVTMLYIAVIRRYARIFGLIDVPNERSIHHEPIARGAGIAFFLALVTIIPFFYMEVLGNHSWFILAVFLIFVTGVYDDIHTTTPKFKFLIIFISTTLLSFDGIIIDALGRFFTIDISLSWFALAFTIFVVSGFTNALNLADGLDGLAASLSIVILTTFFYIGYQHEDSFMMLLSGAFVATLIAFLLYNWYPASIFMGDSGSLMLGFIISVLGIHSLTYIPPVAILYLGAVPILDTLIVMIRRKRAGHSFFSADTCHMHHLFKELFHDNVPKTVLFLVTVQTVYVWIGLQLEKDIEQGWLLFIFIVNILVFYKLFDKMMKKQNRVCP